MANGNLGKVAMFLSAVAIIGYLSYIGINYKKQNDEIKYEKVFAPDTELEYPRDVIARTKDGRKVRFVATCEKEEWFTRGRLQEMYYSEIKDNFESIDTILILNPLTYIPE